MATIYDVAELAGVSPATVSRVFNGTSVSEEKVAAVRDAAAKLNFTPNRTARTLRRQSSEVIALVIPDIENPYFTEMARGVEDVASEAGYSVVLCNSDAQLEKEATYLRIAIAEHMSGIIIATADEQSNLDSILATGRPVVAVDRSTTYDIDGVVMANRAAGTSATRDLIDAGYRRIAYIGGPEHIDT
ncbi:LacI family DNA-binding transcriptional regulator, partial [Microbacterium sp. BF1]